ncbi:MAG: thymidylate kinase [Bacteroidetes bacterium]|nr:thymidylate kinase [Bacteroidota bacterium]
MLVAIEGIDGAGKGTQAQKLLDRALKEGYTAKLLSFPQYQVTQGSKWIAEYLRGDFGELNEVHPLFAGMLFALDRFECKKQIMDSLEMHDLVIMDRYVASNLAYQSARCREGGDDPMKFVDRLLSLEYDIYGLPRPDLTLFLDMPVAFSEHLISERGARAYTREDKIMMDVAEKINIPPGRYDIHEENTEYLHAVHEMYYQLIQSFDMAPCEEINCQNENGVLRSKDDIAREVWSAVQAKLQ